MKVDYEAKALSMIRESRSWAYWSLSRRIYAALKRLEKRGCILWTIGAYPIWEFEIVCPEPIETKGMKKMKVKPLSPAPNA